MSFFESLTNPAKTQLNKLRPSLGGSGVINTPKIGMPQNGGDSQMRAKPGTMRASLSPKLNPLPSYPKQPNKADESLLQTQSPPSALSGIKRPPSASSIGKHLF